ncbi:MAG TPA: tetratricopeptide repeat protein [Verrucomicrobiae bacterium]|jgi:tetratricopeptide (TPR) repeat protein|nr:tetratricopeptide repeat protein [Verrucomicrobiae bacterium]
MLKPTPSYEALTPETSASAGMKSRFPAWLAALLLGLVTILLYWPSINHDFVNYDDPVYVTANAHVQAGLTWGNLKWAFTNPVGPNWHPLTVLSHMLDCQLFGLNPRGHHLTSMVLHTINTMLVFLWLRSLTGATWRSAFVAALFGWHPAHVESVGWVAERKDVLSTCFGLLALIFYTLYAGQSGFQNSKSKIYYWLTLVLFACGLMSKPMLVTWPLVMLLLDYWPLERWKATSWWHLAREKIPFFVLVALASVVTFAVQKHGGAVETSEHLPMGARIGNALVSYCRYLGKLFWPAKLAVFYPHPGSWPPAEVLLAGGFLTVLSALFWWQRSQHPFLLMGWLWFLGTLVPVIGLVQVGDQALADRYTYISSLGIFILVSWGVYELSRGWRYQVEGLSLAGCAVLVLCLAMTPRQLGYWQDSVALFRHALVVTENNPLAHGNLGAALLDKGQNEEAIEQLQEAIRLKPDFAGARNNLATALSNTGRMGEAIDQFQEAVRLGPDDARAHDNLGAALGRKGQMDAAIDQFREAIRLKPDFAGAHNNLGNALSSEGRLDAAIGEFQEAINLKPDFADAYNNLGAALGGKGRMDEAIGQFQEAIRLKPDFARAHNNLGVALGRKGRIDEAIREFQEAIRLKPDFVDARNNLARALRMKDGSAGR